MYVYVCTTVRVGVHVHDVFVPSTCVRTLVVCIIGVSVFFSCLRFCCCVCVLLRVVSAVFVCVSWHNQFGVRKQLGKGFCYLRMCV